MTIMWERTVKEFHFVERVVMSPETFKAMPIIAGTPEATYRLPPCTYGRALIERDGRTSWHAVDRHHQFGVPVYFARPIVVRVYAAEAD